ncbi:MAG: hypothetical protein VCG02_07590 [Verrucomicrobiota bacterium]
MSIAVKEIDLRVINLHTRIPFKYGIATLTRVPHLFVRIRVESEGQSRWGIGADSLPPKWFTKHPDTSFRTEIEEMITVIRQSCAAAETVKADTLFSFWHRLQEVQADHLTGPAHPGLLRGFGTSLVERAMIDAYCRIHGCTFSQALLDNRFGIRLEQVHPSLAGNTPADFLAKPTPKALHIRHTVGLGDPLTEAEIPDDERVHDGLPHALETCIDTYELGWFKIKICGNPERDLPRLAAISHILKDRDFRFTLDGNEQFHTVEAFRETWSLLNREPGLRAFMQHLVFVEQPFHRDIALNPDTAKALLAWKDRPPMIIDESDAELHSAATALQSGYVGSSHKNCKGVFKGIANACLIRSVEHGILSGEDLVNIGPVALLQDLAVAASLGITHIERNGHHYFRGLAAFPETVQQQVLEHHADLYQSHPLGFPTLAIRQGKIEIGTVLDSPFGIGFELDPEAFIPLENWNYETLEA